MQRIRATLDGLQATGALLIEFACSPLVDAASWACTSIQVASSRWA